MDRRLDWIVWKGGFAAALFFAIVEQVEWVQYALTAFVWWILFACVSALLEESAPRRIGPASVPRPFVMAFDLGVLTSMFLAHWHWTAFAYAAACGCVELIKARATSKP